MIHEILDMRTPTVIGFLNVSMLCRSVMSASFTSHFGPVSRDPVEFLNPLVTRDESCLHMYDPETEEQSEEWRHSGSQCPGKFASKVLVSVFWDKDGILLVDYLGERCDHHGKVLRCTS
jgi:hypothetical protein